MNVEIGTDTPIFLFWDDLFQSLNFRHFVFAVQGLPRPLWGPLGDPYPRPLLLLYSCGLSLVRRTIAMPDIAAAVPPAVARASAATRLVAPSPSWRVAVQCTPPSLRTASATLPLTQACLFSAAANLGLFAGPCLPFSFTSSSSPLFSYIRNSIPAACSQGCEWNDR